MTSDILWSLAVLFTTTILLWLLSGWIRAVFMIMGLPPGPPSMPIIGHAGFASNSPKLTELGRQAYQQYGSIFRIWLTVLPAVVLLEPEQLQFDEELKPSVEPWFKDPEKSDLHHWTDSMEHHHSTTYVDVKIVLSSNKHTDKMFFYKLIHNFVGKGLITINGEKWKYHRRLLQPMFHLTILETFIETFHKNGNILVKKLQDRNDLHSLNITSLVNECVLSILHETVFGISLKDQQTAGKESSPFRQGKVVAPYRILHPWLLLNCVYRFTQLARYELEQQKRLVKFTAEMIRERKKSRMADSCSELQQRNSFLDKMLEIEAAESSFTEEDAIQELCTFMLAGQDSVGATLAFCLFKLAQHPEIQREVIKEIEEVLGTEDKAPTLSDLQQLKFLEQVIKETMRLYPSVPFIFRTLDSDIKIGKYVIPARAGVMIVPFATHRLGHIYNEPEKFDPSRFLPEEVKKRHPCAFIPFSAGPRNCIGYKFSMLEMKTIIATLLKKYWVAPVAGKDKLTLSYRITLRASGGVWLNLVPREHN